MLQAQLFPDSIIHLWQVMVHHLIIQPIDEVKGQDGLTYVLAS